MDFMSMIRAIHEGRRVRRPCRAGVVVLEINGEIVQRGLDAYSPAQPCYFCMEDVLAHDWEVVE